MGKATLKKVCVVTAARSEYGLLRWILEELKYSEDFHLQVIVTGSHLAPEQGMTVQAIEDDGFFIDKKIEMFLSTSSSVGIGKSMGLCGIGIADALEDLHPDLLVVLGDRYELLPICSTALVMNILIAHISGGDITEGAIDDQVRNAITMMASLHFPGTSESAARIERMLGKRKNIFSVGEPGLDSFKRYKLMSRLELSQRLSLDIKKKWILLTLHPETKETIEYNVKMAENLVISLNDVEDIQVVITQANADLGGVEINRWLSKIASKNPCKYSFHRSLGQLCYLSMIKEAFAMVGNSSSGIVEAPFLGKPAINVGNRQKGRHLCANVISADNDIKSLSTALKHLDGFNPSLDYFYGDGETSKRIVEHIKNFLQNES